MGFVDFEQRGPIGIVTMNRPEALNALNDQVLKDLDAVLDQAEAPGGGQRGGAGAHPHRRGPVLCGRG